MIRNPTVLIFGAGVSHENGFPLGRRLLIDISTELENERSDLILMLAACDFAVPQMRLFQRELIASMQPSVDAFLEQQVNHANLGKAAIAAALIPKELIEPLQSRDEMKLYEYLWHQIAGSPGSYTANRLSVVTFNYDRSFEEFLARVLKASHPEFRDDLTKLRAVLSHFEPIHIYGSLGDLNPASEDYLPYDAEASGRPEIRPDEILRASRRLKLYHESEGDKNVSDKVRELFFEAETVCFLGFGFHPENIKRLQVAGLGQRPNTRYYASAHGVKPGEKHRVRELLELDEIEFGDDHMGSLQFIRSFPVLV